MLILIIKILLLALAFHSLTTIVITLVQMGMVMRSKGRASVGGWFFTIRSILFALSVSILIVIW